MDESGLIGIHNPVGLGDVHKPLDVVQNPCDVVQQKNSHLYCNVRDGGPIQRDGVIFGQNVFSNISLYWPRDKKSIVQNIEF